MALLFQEMKDGIQLGRVADKCKGCEQKAKANRDTLRDELLTNKEAFILNINGIRHCYCMDCFQDLLGDYVLKNKNEEQKLDSNIIEKDNEELLDKGDNKNDTKNAKTGKSSKRK